MHPFITLVRVDSASCQKIIPIPNHKQLAWQEAELGAVFHYDLHVFDGERYVQSNNRIHPIYDYQISTEHRGEIKNCPHCQTVNRALFPVTVTQPTQYGSNVQQLAVYFTQHSRWLSGVPYGRTSEIFKDLFGHGLNGSSLVNNSRRCADKLQPFITDLKAKLLKQPVLHADKTVIIFECQRNWLHTLCTDSYTYFAELKINNYIAPAFYLIATANLQKIGSYRSFSTILLKTWTVNSCIFNTVVLFFHIQFIIKQQKVKLLLLKP